MILLLLVFRYHTYTNEVLLHSSDQQKIFKFG